MQIHKCSVPIEREVIDAHKNWEKKLYPTDYNSLIVQDLWQALYQILFIILLKEFIELNVNKDIITKYVKHRESNTKITKLKLLKIKCKYFLEYTTSKDNLIKHKCLCCNKNYQKFDESLKKKVLIHTNFRTMISISLF